MSRIYKAFEQKSAFIGFLTAGDPNASKCVEYILEMEKAGADLIEIGIPFSDPVAEGLVIQRANARALQNGITTNKVFEIVKEVRKTSSIPLVFLTYLNPVFKYGYEAFFKKCKEYQVDGIIIPDLPFEEKEEVDIIARKYQVDLISLIAPTSKERMKMIASEAKGFIYLVSSLGVTGMRSEIADNLENIINDIKEVSDVPVAIGFGINTCKQAKYFSSISDGVIVGSAIVKIIEDHGENAKEALYDYVSRMVAAK